MDGRLARLLAHVPGQMVMFGTLFMTRHVDGYPWGLPNGVALVLTVIVAVVLGHVVTHAVVAYFGFDRPYDDDGGDGDGPDDDDDDPDDPIIVPDTPEALYEHSR